MRNVNPNSLALYAVTDSRWLKEGETLADKVKACLDGGVSFVQLREKNLSTKERIHIGKQLKELCLRYDVPFVIDDDVLAAKALGVGVHVGQEDAELSYARSVLGPDAIIGVSCESVEQAIKAQVEGADYLGVGSFVYTPTKPDAHIVSLEELDAIAQAVHIPIVAIGGINKETIENFKGRDIDGVAVVSALFNTDNPKLAAKELSCLVKKHILSH